jgi:hypothetical protein
MAQFANTPKGHFLLISVRSINEEGWGRLLHFEPMLKVYNKLHRNPIYPRAFRQNGKFLVQDSFLHILAEEET